jgi:omega-6 fatty acid desaturase (delta-12 desaturase)
LPSTFGDASIKGAPASAPKTLALERPSHGDQAFIWREVLAPYARARVSRGLADLASSVLPYLGLYVAMYLSLNVSYWLTLALAVPTSGFALRTFVVFHDCTHGSFMPSRRANAWLGRVLGLIMFSPFVGWRHDHLVHHATSGDLDRRGGGDVLTLTVAEYRSRPWLARLGYRLFRNPLVMFGLGPLYAMVINPRLVPSGARRRIRRSILLTNTVLALAIATVCWFVGWQDFLLVQTPCALLAGGAGIWLFYVQHQFEDTYWQAHRDWSFADAALRGSSYLKLPEVLRFFTANIGFHHIHHLSARIPNYNLKRAHDENPVFQAVPTLSLWDGMRAVRLKLWDEDEGRLVTFAQARSRAGGSRVIERPESDAAASHGAVGT